MLRLTWVYLKGSDGLIRDRLQHRQHHFMKPGMLASQFADLGEPLDAIVVDICVERTLAVAKVVGWMNLSQAKAS